MSRRILTPEELAEKYPPKACAACGQPLVPRETVNKRGFTQRETPAQYAQRETCNKRCRSRRYRQASSSINTRRALTRFRRRYGAGVIPAQVTQDDPEALSFWCECLAAA